MSAAKFLNLSKNSLLCFPYLLQCYFGNLKSRWQLIFLYFWFGCGWCKLLLMPAIGQLVYRTEVITAVLQMWKPVTPPRAGSWCTSLNCVGQSGINGNKGYETSPPPTLPESSKSPSPVLWQRRTYRTLLLYHLSRFHALWAVPKLGYSYPSSYVRSECQRGRWCCAGEPWPWLQKNRSWGLVMG